MRLIDSARRAGRSLKSAKGRTLLTSLAIAVGAFTLTLSLAAGEGARRYADKLISSNIDPQTILVAKDPSLFQGGAAGAGGLREYSDSQTSLGGATFKALNKSDLERIRRTQGVSDITPTYLVSAKYITFQGKDTRYVADVTAYDPNVRAETAAGSLPQLGKTIGTNDIVVPESFLTKLRLKAEQLIGQTVTLRLVKPATQPSQAEIQRIIATEGVSGLVSRSEGESRDESFRVSAISAQSSTSFSAAGGLFIAADRARELSEFLTADTDQYQEYVTATVRAADGAKPADVKAALERGGVTARTADDLQQVLFTIVNVLQGIVAGFGVLALIASVFGIINTQYISVLERTREIGLMKALGMRGRHVSRLFQFEAAWIGLLGGALGATLACILGSLANPVISDKLSLGDIRLLVFLPLPTIGLVIALMLAAMLAGYVPARKAAKLDLIEALRSE